MNVQIGNLPSGISEKTLKNALRNLFREFRHDVEDEDIDICPGGRIAFVEMSNANDVKAAIADLNDRCFGGRRLQLTTRRRERFDREEFDTSSVFCHRRDAAKTKTGWSRAAGKY